MDTFLINSYIEELIDSQGQSEEAREKVASLLDSLPYNKPLKAKSVIQSNHTGDAVAGETGIGQVSYQDSEKDEIKIKEYGYNYRRIGRYKLSMRKGKKSSAIFIRDFWKDDEGTQSETEDVQAWVLELDSENRPGRFSQEAKSRKIRLFNMIHINTNMLVDLWSSTGDLGKRFSGYHVVIAVG